MHKQRDFTVETTLFSDSSSSTEPTVDQIRRRLGGLWPFHFWNIIQAVAISCLGLAVCLFLFFYPDIAAKILSKISVRSAAELSNKTYELLRDMMIIYGIVITFICLDALSRNTQQRSLFRLLFFARNDIFQSYEKTLLAATFWITFFVVPILIFLNLGHSFLDLNWITNEDGPLEYLTAVNFIIAGAILSFKGWQNFVRPLPRDYRNAAIFAALGGMMFFVGFEEISWGQRIVGFETPASLLSINTQGEFNVHNIVTRELLQSYVYANMIIFFASFLSFLVMVKNFHFQKIRWLLVYLPDPSLMIILAVMIFFSNHVHLNDLVEQLASLVVLLYSVRLAVLFWNPRNDRRSP